MVAALVSLPCGVDGWPRVQSHVIVPYTSPRRTLVAYVGQC